MWPIQADSRRNPWNPFYSDRLVTAPVEHPVSLPDVKRHLKIDFKHDDAEIDDLIRTATALIEGAGLALMMQRREFVFSCFPVGYLEVPRPPLVGVKMFYHDGEGVERQFTDFTIHRGDAVPAKLFPVNSTWPTTSSAIRLDATCGYSSQSEVPQDLKHWVMLECQRLYYQEKDDPLDRAIRRIRAKFHTGKYAAF